MLDIGWTEMLVLLVVALFIVGPKDIPRALRVVGRWVGKIRGLAREFQDTVEDAVRESELEDVRKQLSDAQKGLSNTIDSGAKLKSPETLITSNTDEEINTTNNSKLAKQTSKETVNLDSDIEANNSSQFVSDSNLSNEKNNIEKLSNNNINDKGKKSLQRKVPQGLKHLSENKETSNVNKNTELSSKGKIEAKKDT